MNAPARACRKCKARVTSGRSLCDNCQAKIDKAKEVKNNAHMKQYDKLRGSPSERGYDGAWTKIRRTKLANNPLCERCESKGRVEAAVLVHHIVPVSKDWSRRLDQSNLMSLCFVCHEVVEGRMKDRK